MVNQIGRPHTEKITIIGGPCRYELCILPREQGLPVTETDRNLVPGGMLTLGIPAFRLEKDVLNAEIDILREMGVEFRCGVEVGKDVTIQQLRDEGLLGLLSRHRRAEVGKAQYPRRGALRACSGGVEFLREVNLGNKPAIGKALCGNRRRQRRDGCVPQRGASRRGGDLYHLPPLSGRNACRPRRGQRGNGGRAEVPLPQCTCRDHRP